MASCQHQQQQHCDCQTRYIAIVVDEACEPNPPCSQQHVEDTTWKPLVLFYPPADMAPLPQPLWPYPQNYYWSAAITNPQYHWSAAVQPYLWQPMQHHYHHHNHQLPNFQHYQLQHQQQVMQQQQYYHVAPFPYPQEHPLSRSHYYIQHQQQSPYVILNQDANLLARHHRPQPIIFNGCLDATQRRAANLEASIPIDAQPARTRQAYGMDKVWQEEFEHLFAQLLSTGVHWNLVEVESNPIILESSNIVGYKGCYLVDVNNRTQPTYQGAESNESLEPNAVSDEGDDVSTRANSCEDDEGDDATSVNDRNELTEANDETDADGQKDDDDYDVSADGSATSDTSEDAGSNQDDNHQQIGDNSEHHQRGLTANNEEEVAHESDQDSGCQVNSEPGSDTCVDSSLVVNEASSLAESNSQPEPTTTGIKPANGSRKFPTRFRMFIDSAKVRFCCDTCGHGWTSMKGRVVFWYELFELIDNKQPAGNTLIGYCAYKLFGQQCDVCKIENRFEKPMWYPEEVAKVLNNLYNKIGQVYFGFEMPAIDKQRRAGKPKTSHNSLLCQACHDGVCTDRK